MPGCLPAKASPQPATLLWEASGPSPHLITGTIRTKFNRSHDFAYLNFGQKIFLTNLPGPCYDPIPSPDCSARLTAGSSFQPLPPFLPSFHCVLRNLLTCVAHSHTCSLTHLRCLTPRLSPAERAAYSYTRKLRLGFGNVGANVFALPGLPPGTSLPLL